MSTSNQHLPTKLKWIGGTVLVLAGPFLFTGLLDYFYVKQFVGAFTEGLNEVNWTNPHLGKAMIAWVAVGATLLFGQAFVLARPLFKTWSFFFVWPFILTGVTHTILTFATWGNIFDALGKSDLVYGIDDDNTVEYFSRRGRERPIHPRTGEVLEPVTPENVREIELRRKSDFLEITQPTEIMWFAPGTGRPKLWYSERNDGLHFFNQPGYDPATSKRLTPVTTELQAKYYSEKKARQAAADQTLHQQREEAEKNRVTGKAKMRQGEMPSYANTTTTDGGTGEAEMRQGEMLFDEKQFRAAHQKFALAVDHGAIGSEICNAKALASLLSRRDYRRVLELGSRLRQPETRRRVTFSLGNLFRSGGGWRSYYPVFEVLALRASGKEIEARSYADVSAKAFSKPTMWPAPLLMYFSGDFTFPEFQKMLDGDPGPAAETEALLAIDDYLRGNEGAASSQRVRRALSAMEMQTKWEGAKLLQPMSDLLPRGPEPSTSTSEVAIPQPQSASRNSVKTPEQLPHVADSAAKTERVARLLALFTRRPLLIGKQLQGNDIFPFKLQIQSFSSATGEFSGHIDYTNLGSVHVIEGQLVEDTFGFKEISIIKKGRSILDSSHSFRLLPDGTIQGKWTSIERMWADWGNGKRQEIGSGITHSGTETISMPASH